jgi:hypothetical protein
LQFAARLTISDMIEPPRDCEFNVKELAAGDKRMLWKNTGITIGQA